MKLAPIFEGVVKSWGSDERIHISHDKIVNLTDYTNRQDDYKPIGLWYGFGDAWLNHIVDMQFYGKGKTFRYKIYVDKSKLLILNTKDDINKLFEKYGFKEKYYSNYIHWKDVAKNYMGVEIPNYNNSDIQDLRWTHPWLNIWDIPSGCIWNPMAIKRIKLIGELKPEQERIYNKYFYDDDV